MPDIVNNYTEEQLDTAASAPLQTSPTDTTAGAVMTVGAFGLGGDAVITTNLNTATTPATYYFASGATGEPDFGGFGHLTVTKFQTSLIQTARSYLTGAVEQRYSNNTGGTWSAWQPVYTGANYQPETSLGIGVKQRIYNASAGSVANGATTAGTNLQTVKTDLSGNATALTTASGTWKNTSGGAISGGEIGEFTRIA